MSIQMFIHDLYEFLHFVCVYYVTILGFCVLISIAVAGIILVLRSTVFSKRVFGKAALWALMIPCLFCGKLHMFFETKIGVKIFLWWYEICVRWQVVCIVYMLVGIGLGMWLAYRRKKLHRIVDDLPECGDSVSRYEIKVFPGDISSFCTGCIKPVIVISDGLPKDQIQIIVKHEETHISLGHLWIQMLWEVLRVLLWPNLLLHICEKYVKRDLEDVCDAVTMQRNDIGAIQYGEILLDNARRIAKTRGSYGIMSGMSFSWEDSFDALKKRLDKITQHRRYNKAHLILGTVLAIALLLALIIGLKIISYDRYNYMNSGSVFSVDKMDVIIYDHDNSVVMSCDDEYIYVDCAELKRRCPEIVNEKEDIYFAIGGYYKIPGMGGGSDIGWLDARTIAENDGIIKIEKYSGIDFWNRIIMWL